MEEPKCAGRRHFSDIPTFRPLVWCVKRFYSRSCWTELGVAQIRTCVNCEVPILFQFEIYLDHHGNVRRLPARGSW